MKKARLATTSRLSLDNRFVELKPVTRFTPPVRGWIKAIREALSMNTAQLAARLKVSQPAVVTLEQSEVKGTIQLATLRRVAEALDCTLVYALVPNKPLETMVQEQTRKVARRRLKSVEHTMLLEDQSLEPAGLEAQIDAYVADIDPRSLWDKA
jgi:predicted DNA-binding mobile mystery protein A